MLNECEYSTNFICVQSDPDLLFFYEIGCSSPGLYYCYEILYNMCSKCRVFTAKLLFQEKIGSNLNLSICKSVKTVQVRGEEEMMRKSRNHEKKCIRFVLFYNYHYYYQRTCQKSKKENEYVYVYVVKFHDSLSILSFTSSSIQDSQLYQVKFNRILIVIYWYERVDNVFISHELSFLCFVFQNTYS